ncbi:YfhO family protein [Butyrivibrio sp. INlla16]|uniref:YfhO family protein n=1 Tax=Butyrivibrio sp. INlla16 TaxID=1520807 RepID=UPI00147A035E|nr:YfhO family protein [Butyrivibrio sp. INlla16]
MKEERRIEYLQIAIIVILPILLFGKYIIGVTNFVLGDIASDNIFQTYPELVHIANRIESGENDVGYTFSLGLGSGEGPIFLGLSNWFCVFGSQRVAYFEGISIVLKIILSGLFIYQWARIVGVTGIKKMILVLGYEFNAMLTTRAAWQSYPNLALLVALNIYLIEKVINNFCIFNCLFLVLSLIVSYGELGLYYSLVYGSFLLFYFFIRLIFVKRLKIKKIAVTAGFFIFFSGVFFWDRIQGIFSSNRFIYNYTIWMNSMTHWYKDVSFSYLLDAFRRTIGQSIGGIYTDYIGTSNLLGGPALYCGILVFLLVPVAFYNLDIMKKCFFGFFYLLAVAYLSIPAVNILFNGFAYSYMVYKLSSFWIPLLFIFNVCIFLNSVEKHSVKEASIVVFNITAIICLFALIIMRYRGEVTRLKDYILSDIFIVAYTIIINLFCMYKNDKLYYVLLVVLCFESVLVSWSVVNDRESFSDEQIETYFNNGSHLITDNDKSWYRIECYYPDNGCFCGSLVGDYYGLQDYIGGLGLSSDIVEFYRCFGLPESEGKYQMGTGANIYMNALLGVKYSILEDRLNFEYGMRKTETIEGKRIYYNTLSLPLAYVYDAQIKNSDFEDMTIIERNRAVLQGVLLDDEIDDIKKISINDVSDTVPIDCSTIDLGETGGVVRLEASDESVYVLELEKDKLQEVSEFVTISYSDGIHDEKALLHEVLTPLEIKADTDVWVRYDIVALNGINLLTVKKYNAGEYYNKIGESVKILQQQGLRVMSQDRHLITGDISVTQGGILATTIPWSSAWKVKIDGEYVDTFKVNKCFIGAKINEGYHSISFEYPYVGWFSSIKKELYKRIAFLVCFLVSMTLACGDYYCANKWRFAGGKFV